MKFLLDSTILIDILRKKKEIEAFLKSHPDDYLVTSTVCEAETAVGIYRSNNRDVSRRKEELKEVISSLDEIIPFDSNQSDIFGSIKAGLSQKGQLIDDLDIMIAACALSRNAVILTGNTKHFARIPNLQVQTI